MTPVCEVYNMRRNATHYVHTGCAVQHRTAEAAHRCGDWGEPYACGDGRPAFITPNGPVWMYRKGCRVRFFTEHGEQVGPEQCNVVPALVYAAVEGWIDPDDPGMSALLNAGIREQVIR